MATKFERMEVIKVKVLASDNKVTVKIPNDNSKKTLGFVLITMSIFSFVFPLSLLFIDDLNVGFGYILTIAIFFGSGVYFLRMFLWDFYGQEIFESTGVSLLHYYDYKFFKDGIQNYKSTNFTKGYCLRSHPDNYLITLPEQINSSESYYICFVSAENEVIRSTSIITYDELVAFLKI